VQDAIPEPKTATSKETAKNLPTAKSNIALNAMLCPAKT
jgi:hypothetical protein